MADLPDTLYGLPVVGGRTYTPVEMNRSRFGIWFIRIPSGIRAGGRLLRKARLRKKFQKAVKAACAKLYGNRYVRFVPTERIPPCPPDANS